MKVLLTIPGDLAGGYILSRLLLNASPLFDLYLQLPSPPLTAALFGACLWRTGRTLLPPTSLRTQTALTALLTLLAPFAPLAQNITRPLLFQREHLFSRPQKKDRPSLVAKPLPLAEHFVALPSPDLLKKGNERILTPRVDIADLKGNIVGRVRQKEAPDIQQFLQIARRGNPLFSRTYPELYKNDVKPKDLIALIGDALELSPRTLWSHLLICGPFLSGHADLQSYLWHTQNQGRFRRIVTISFAGALFLRLSWQRKNLSAKKIYRAERLISLDGIHPEAYLFHWEYPQEFSKKDSLTEEFLQRAEGIFSLSADAEALRKYHRTLGKYLQPDDHNLRKRLRDNLARVIKLTQEIPEG